MVNFSSFRHWSCRARQLLHRYWKAYGHAFVTVLLLSPRYRSIFFVILAAEVFHTSRRLDPFRFWDCWSGRTEFCNGLRRYHCVTDSMTFAVTDMAEERPAPDRRIMEASEPGHQRITPNPSIDGSACHPNNPYYNIGCLASSPNTLSFPVMRPILHHPAMVSCHVAGSRNASGSVYKNHHPSSSHGHLLLMHLHHSACVHNFDTEQTTRQGISTTPLTA
ncbi:hypothetical protein VTI74DRAFT_10488 [Chaetomium olivicolor]